MWSRRCSSDFSAGAKRGMPSAPLSKIGERWPDRASRISCNMSKVSTTGSASSRQTLEASRVMKRRVRVRRLTLSLESLVDLFNCRPVLLPVPIQLLPVPQALSAVSLSSVAKDVSVSLDHFFDASHRPGDVEVPVVAEVAIPRVRRVQHAFMFASHTATLCSI